MGGHADPPVGGNRLVTGAMHPVAAGTLVFSVSGAVLVLEILAVRLVAPYVGVSIQTYTAIIGVVLAGISVGTWAGGWLADVVDPRRCLGPVLVAGGLLSLAMPTTVENVADALVGPGRSGVIGVIALVSFFPAVAVLSATNPLVVKLQLRSLAHTGQVVGRLSALGTAGALAGTFVTGFVLVPAFPTSRVVLVLGGVLVVVGAVLLFMRGGNARRLALLATAGAAAMTLVGATQGPRCDAETSYSCVKLLRDPSRPTGRLLVLDTIHHAYVDLRNPELLSFGYARVIGGIVDSLAPRGTAVRVLHLGGGGFTLPRYVEATRPGSINQVLEIDGGLVRFVRDELAVDPDASLRVRVGDARPALRDVATGAYDLVIGDAFAGRTVPWQLATVEAAREVQRTLRTSGSYALNMIDQPPLDLVRAEARTLMRVFAEVALIAPRESAGGEEGGNFVFWASDKPLPIGRTLPRILDREPLQIIVAGADLERFAGSGDVLTDDFAPADQLITR